VKISKNEFLANSKHHFKTNGTCLRLARKRGGGATQSDKQGEGSPLRQLEIEIEIKAKRNGDFLSFFLSLIAFWTTRY
jgi:hypothetical protein